MTEKVPAAHYWASNAHLIADAAALHLDPAMEAVDTTYGEGNWWKIWRPESLVCHDLYKLDGIDFRKLPEPDRTYDLAAFDPPYVSMGGRKTSGLPGMMDAFGMRDAPSTPAGLQADVDDGLAEVHRVLRPKGLALVKCQSYVSSGRLWPGEHLTLAAALLVGFEVVDVFTHLNRGRPQPSGRTARGVPSRQQHAWPRPSTLYVLRRPLRRGPPAAG